MRARIRVRGWCRAGARYLQAGIGSRGVEVACGYAGLIGRAIVNVHRHACADRQGRGPCGGQGTAEDEAALNDLARNTPQAARVPRLLYADATPEALSHDLASGWPIGAVMSAEAGAAFGAHGMGYETIMRNLALLNVLWDGGEIAIDRRSKPSFRLRDRRLTFGLMVQLEALRGFPNWTCNLPRSNGLIPRSLVAQHKSAQSTRCHGDAPSAISAEPRFETRIYRLPDTFPAHTHRWRSKATRVCAVVLGLYSLCTSSRSNRMQTGSVKNSQTSQCSNC
jgi:hypothetical protein